MSCFIDGRLVGFRLLSAKCGRPSLSLLTHGCHGAGFILSEVPDCLHRFWSDHYDPPPWGLYVFEKWPQSSDFAISTIELAMTTMFAMRIEPMISIDSSMSTF